MRLTIGKLSKQTGVHIETIRYYEREGLIDIPNRTVGGHRIYVDSDVERLRFIRRARDLGFSLDEVRQLLSLSDGDQQCRDVRRVAERHLAEIHEKIRDLRALETSLKRLTKQCRQTPDDECPIVDALRLGGR